MATVVSILLALRDSCRSRAVLQLEVLALRHQLYVLKRTAGRSQLTRCDRLLWIWLARVWRGWRDAIMIVKPATVIGWHRRGCLLVWSWKSRRRFGRPPDFARGLCADCR
jgi:putative transposase